MSSLQWLWPFLQFSYLTLSWITVTIWPRTSNKKFLFSKDFSTLQGVFHICSLWPFKASLVSLGSRGNIRMFWFIYFPDNLAVTDSLHNWQIVLLPLLFVRKKCALFWRWSRGAWRFLEGHCHCIFSVSGRSYKRGKCRPPLFRNKVISHSRPGLLTSVPLDFLTDAIWVSLWMWTVIHNIRECHLHRHIFLYRKQWHDWVWVWESKWLTCDLEMEVTVPPAKASRCFNKLNTPLLFIKCLFSWDRFETVVKATKHTI